MFVPQRILFEKNVMEYDIAQNIYNEFKDNKKIEIIDLSSNRIKQHIPGDNKEDSGTSDVPPVARLPYLHSHWQSPDE